MKAALLHGPGQPLELCEVPRPVPDRHDLLVRVHTCGVCRTDLHIIDGELTARYPIIPGHQIVGSVEEIGPEVTEYRPGDMVGITWLASTCGHCHYCAGDRENLCTHGQFTGLTRPGGFAEYTTVDSRYAFALPAGYSPSRAAPLLCAGAIGYRSLRLAGRGRRLGLYGFGAAAHFVAQIAFHRGWRIYAFTRPGDVRAQAFARHMGAIWAGDSDCPAPEELDAAIIFAPVGELIPLALAAVAPGGTVVCGGIHMSDIPSFPYRLLWKERALQSVANLTRRDARELLGLASSLPIDVHVIDHRLEDVNRVVDAMRSGQVEAASVLTILHGADAVHGYSHDRQLDGGDRSPPFHR